MTVLARHRDPYRLDTDAHHRNGQWAADQLARFYGSTKQAHWRGLHYSIIMAAKKAKAKVKKPDGTLFANTEDDWIWLNEKAGKAARWLGYIPFDRIIDKRNNPAIVHRKAKVEPSSALLGFDVEIPVVEPMPDAEGFVVRQSFCFAIFAEKASLEEICLPIAEAYEADLYLGTGETSDTFIYEIARDAVADGRPLVMFTLTDCDPSGWQMFISIARKLQAIQDLLFPQLQWEIVPVALMPEHLQSGGRLRDLELPQEPIKAGDSRAKKWRDAFGVEQTEIDALTTPEMTERGILREMLEEAFLPYINSTLADRVRRAASKWERDAQAVVDTQSDRAAIATLEEEAERLRERAERINAELAVATEHVTLPAIEVPRSRVNLQRLDVERQAVIKFDDDWLKATKALIARKQYLGDDDE